MPFQPKISIITATWNCADTIAGCIESVATQTYQNREHIIIDGASTDETLNVLDTCRQHLDVFVTEPDRGIYDALNKGIALATGDIIGFLHADDFFSGNDVLEAVAFAFADPGVSAVYGDLEYVRQHDVEHVVRKWKAGRCSPVKLRWGWMPPHPTLYVRREWYRRVGSFDRSFQIAADYLSVLSLFSQPDFVPKYLPRVLVRMRLGGASNRSIRNIVQKSHEDYRALRQTGVGGVGALVWKNLSKVRQFIAP
jgi:glycosyltransferase involved in cell wall biosynthesis